MVFLAVVGILALIALGIGAVAGLIMFYDFINRLNHDVDELKDDMTTIRNFRNFDGLDRIRKLESECYELRKMINAAKSS